MIEPYDRLSISALALLQHILLMLFFFSSKKKYSTIRVQQNNQSHFSLDNNLCNLFGFVFFVFISSHSSPHEFKVENVFGEEKNKIKFIAMTRSINMSKTKLKDKRQRI